MKIFLLILGMIITIHNVEAQIVIEQLPDVEYKNYDGTTFIPNSENYPRISKIEEMLFLKTFEQEPIEIRLKRIEQKLYKKENINLALSERVELISKKLDEMSISNKDKSTLTTLERKIFNQAYLNDNIESRTQRLEKYILGAIQQGELNQRIATLKTACASIGNEQYQMQTYPQINQSIGTKLKNALNFMTTGALTGFSPPVRNYYNPYQNYSPYMQNTMPYYPQMPMNNPNLQNMFGFSDGGEMYYDNGEYIRKIKNIGGNCGVKIID